MVKRFGTHHLAAPGVPSSRTFKYQIPTRNAFISRLVWLGETEKSHIETYTGEYRIWDNTGMFFNVRFCVTKIARWHSALSCWRVHVLAMSGRTLTTLFRNRSCNSRGNCWFTVCPGGMKSLCNTPLLSKKLIVFVLISVLLYFKFLMLPKNLSTIHSFITEYSSQPIYRFFHRLDEFNTKHDPRTVARYYVALFLGHAPIEPTRTTQHS